MTPFLHGQTRGSSCQVVPGVPAEPQITGVSVPALVRTEQLKLLFHIQNEPSEILSMDHSASAGRFSSMLVNLGEDCSNIQNNISVIMIIMQQYPDPKKGQEIFLRASSGFWRLTQCGAASWAQLHRHSYGLQLFPEDRTISKIILLSKKLFFSKAVLAPVFHSCLFYIRARSTSISSLLQATFQLFVKSSWKFTYNLPGFGLAGCKNFVKHVGSYFSPGVAEILKVKRGQQEHLYVS